MVCRQRPPGRTSISWIVVLKPFGPHHCATCFGSTNASHTSSRGASNRRDITISRSGVTATELFFSLIADMLLLLMNCFSFRFGCFQAGIFRAGIFQLVLFELVQIGVEAVETLFPELAIVFHPVRHFFERGGFQP